MVKPNINSLLLRTHLLGQFADTLKIITTSCLCSWMITELKTSSAVLQWLRCIKHNNVHMELYIYMSERVNVSAYLSIESIPLEPTQSFMHEGLAARSRTRAPKNKELQLLSSSYTWWDFNTALAPSAGMSKEPQQCPGGDLAPLQVPVETFSLNWPPGWSCSHP